MQALLDVARAREQAARHEVGLVVRALARLDAFASTAGPAVVLAEHARARECARSARTAALQRLGAATGLRRALELLAERKVETLRQRFGNADEGC